MALNIENTRKLLQAFDFKTLFIEELGWNNPKNKAAFAVHTKDHEFARKAIAELSGATVFEITNAEGFIPDSKTRDVISKEIQKINFEHILIFIDKNRTQTIWRWLKKQDKKNLPREHYFSAGQTGDLFIAKLAGLMVDISEIENNITITDVARKIQSALDVERVTKQFYRNYQDQFIDFLKLIQGIDNEADRRWYASVILNRLMFIYFLQKKGFVDNNNQDYLYAKLKETKSNAGKNQYYNSFLKVLFFEGFAKPEKLRTAAINKILGKVKYLNGGLFLKHKIEEKYPDINIPDIAFENLLQSEEPKGLFERFSWSLDDTPGGNDNEINPDVLGYIFEKYINQKAFGAYYTRTEITEYLCEQTVYKLILDAVNEEKVDAELLKKAGLDKLPAKVNYTNIAELLISLDAATCRKLIDEKHGVLPNLSLLDPACGSGAFLVAAMKTLINVYSAILGRIDFLADKKLLDWKKKIEEEHPSINYYIKKRIITNNLYGVDIMEEATEIAKLRLFLALVASAQTVDQLEPLPNIDFNIMSGNSLIGLLRVDANQFNKHFQPTTSKSAKGKIVQNATLFNQATVQGGLFAGEHAKSYQQLINEKEAAVASYKNAHELGVTDLQELRDSIQKQEAEASKILNELLLEEFATLGIKYEQVTWDETKNKEGKSIKRNLSLRDIESLEPFHWGYEFSEIFRKKDGFDAIIANPPWEIFKPTAKEFFKEYSELGIQRRMLIEDFNIEKDKLLVDPQIRKKWLDYLSKYPHTSNYYRNANKYKHQSSKDGEKKTGSDINLYKLFLEQSYNLLKPGGRCGIIIPSGIYLDAGNKELRKLLFTSNVIENLYGISNEKFLFEEVEHNIKYALLSFIKGGKTNSFNICFRINPRVAVSQKELDFFLNDDNKNIKITTEQIFKLSTASLAIPEIKNDTELHLLLKISEFDLFGDESIKLGNEFHMTNDSVIFKSSKSEEDMRPLCEGKTIHQFNYKHNQPRYWVNLSEGRSQMLGKAADNGQNLSYQRFRLAFRAIARATDSRTMIAAMLPPNVFSSNSLAVSVNEVNYNSLLSFLAIFNSLAYDFTLRSKISSNLNFYYVYNLPTPKLLPSDKWYQPVINRSARLTCTTDEFAELWEEVMKTKWSESVAAIKDTERNQLRAELDGIIAHLYGLTEEEFAYILSTFPLVAQEQKVAAQNAYRDVITGALKS